MVKTSRRVRARNPLKIALAVLAVVALAGGLGGGWYWWAQRQATAAAATAQAVADATARAVSQAATAAAEAGQHSAATTATALAAELNHTYQQGIANQNAGQYEPARAAFQTVIDRQPDYKDAVARLKQINELLADAYYQQAAAAANQLLWADAVAGYDKVLAIIPNYKDTAARRAAAAKELGVTPTPKPSPTPAPTAIGAGTTSITDTRAVTATALSPTAGAEATPAGAEATPSTRSATSTPVPQAASGPKPSGDWSVRTYNTDDVAVVLVNGQIVAASLYGDPHGDSGWVKINDALHGGEGNEIVVASWNSSYGRAWGFAVRRNDTQIWGNEQPAGGGPVGMSYVQRLRINADGSITPVAADTTAPKPPPGKWYVRVQGAKDLGVVLVNGLPVALNSVAFAPESGWVEITGQLSSEHDNTLSTQVWNFDADYSYVFQIKRDDTIVWGQSGQGSGIIGIAFSSTAIINKAGQVMLPAIEGKVETQAWAVRSYNTDDVAVVLVNGQIVAASLYGDPHGDSGWVKINDALHGGEGNEIVVASWNSSYGRAWGFAVRRNDTQIWGNEQPAGGGPVGMSYVQRLRISADGSITPVAADTTAPKPPPGKWYVRVQGAKDLGVVLVNGLPVALNSVAFAPESGWVEITGQLSSSHDNTLTMSDWNFDGPFNYKFEIKHDDTIVWGAEKTGGGVVGVALAQSVVITSAGEVKQPQ